MLTDARLLESIGMPHLAVVEGRREEHYPCKPMHVRLCREGFVSERVDAGLPKSHRCSHLLLQGVPLVPYYGILSNRSWDFGDSEPPGWGFEYFDSPG